MPEFLHGGRDSEKWQRFMTDKAKILIVEDDTPLAMMMVHVLMRAGCDVLVANTGKRGMELAQQNKFDLITLDVDLPDISGFEICRELKQRHLSCHTPIVFISGRPCEENRQHGLELGAVDYIAKPFDALGFASRLLSHVKAGKTQEKSNAESICFSDANTERI
jgi:DNA-binding response OmpR family regulator